MDWQESFNESLLNTEALNYLIAWKLDGVAKGITQQVRDRGLHSLSEKQLYIFKRDVVDIWLSKKCNRGNHDVEGHELIGLWENDSYCSRCANSMAKDEQF